MIAAKFHTHTYIYNPEWACLHAHNDFTALTACTKSAQKLWRSSFSSESFFMAFITARQSTSLWRASSCPARSHPDIQTGGGLASWYRMSETKCCPYMRTHLARRMAVFFAPRSSPSPAGWNLCTEGIIRSSPPLFQILDRTLFLQGFACNNLGQRPYHSLLVSIISHTFVQSIVFV